MNKKSWIAFLLVVVLVLMVGVTTAGGKPPLAVHIEVEETISGGVEPFDATGPAVDDGLLCPTGTVVDIGGESSGPPGGGFRILRVLKTFTCGDGSGSFDIRLVVKLDLTTGYTTANWNVVGGTGAYSGLHGNGKLVGTPIVPGVSILDVYDGKLH